MRIGLARALVVAAAALWLAGCSTSGSLTNPFAGNPPGADANASAPPEADSEPMGSIGARASAGDDDLSQGKTLYRANNFSEAEKHFRRATEQHPRDEEAWLGLAATYDRLHRFTEADQAYDRAIAIVGATAEILNNQGYSYMLRHDYKRAHVALKAAQRKDPHNKYVQNNLHLLEQSARRGVAID